MHGGVLGGVQPDPDDRHEVARVAVGERGGVDADARHRAAEAAELDDAERRGGARHGRQRRVERRVAQLVGEHRPERRGVRGGLMRP